MHWARPWSAVIPEEHSFGVSRRFLVEVSSGLACQLAETDRAVVHWPHVSLEVIILSALCSFPRRKCEYAVVAGRESKVYKVYVHAHSGIS